MRQAVLLGSPGTRRTVYLEQAAKEEGLPVLFVDWKDWESGAAHMPEGELLVKIDPPLWESCQLKELDALAGSYRDGLRELASAGDELQMKFLNHPDAIASLLDKRRCKERLQQAGLPVTEMLDVGGTCGEAPGIWEELPSACGRTSDVGGENGGEPGSRRGALPDTDVSGAYDGEPGRREALPGCCRRAGEAPQASFRRTAPAPQMTTERLLDGMRSQRIFQVFIKPVSGSGAAGVSAFRFQPRTGRMALYTCAQLHPEYGLVNTKRLRCFVKREEIVPLLDEVFRTDCIVERWYAKAEHAGYSYDLRMVMQEGEADFLLARLSKGPITNLHLNNHPLEYAQLGLPGRVMEEAAGLCRQAMKCFPGLWSAGIDLLLERGSLRPRVIEMNAQGDLIYQDIFHENRIYRHQAAMMKRWCGAGTGR